MFPLGSVDLKKVAVHFGVYFLGFGAIAGLQYLAKVDFGSFSPFVALLAGAIVDSIRKALDGVKE